MASQQATYVQISRAREETKLYIVSGEKSIERKGLDGREEKKHSLQIKDEGRRKEILNDMGRSWGRNDAKNTTLDYLVEKITLERKFKRENELIREPRQELTQSLGLRR